MKFLTLVNRTSKRLTGTYDGRHYIIELGRNSFPELHALKFKEQNPIMGSQDPYSNRMDYLVGIEEQEDDCSPIEQSSSIELWDRSKLQGPAVDVVKGKGGLFANERQSALPLESAFVKP